MSRMRKRRRRRRQGLQPERAKTSGPTTAEMRPPPLPSWWWDIHLELCARCGEPVDTGPSQTTWWWREKYPLHPDCWMLERAEDDLSGIRGRP